MMTLLAAAHALDRLGLFQKLSWGVQTLFCPVGGEGVLLTVCPRGGGGYLGGQCIFDP